MQKKSKCDRIKSIRPRRIDLLTLIHDVRLTFEETCRLQGVSVEIDVPQNLWVDLDPILMRDAFRKLFDNALEAMPRGGNLTITSLVGRFGLEIEFADSGPGISEELHDRLFEPFVTTKDHHAGLGLSIVREIATAHQGSISALDCPDGGAAFTLLLPLRAAIDQAA